MDRRTLYFTGPGSVELRETTVSEPAGNQLLVETRASAVSPGTERLIYRGEAPTDLPADETIDALSGDLSFPLSYGYAAVGEVIAAGESVDRGWLGTDVFAFVPHQSAFLASPEEVIAVPSDVDVETATLLPTVETAANLVLDGRPRLGERVVVFGAGAVGLATLQLLAAFPLERLVAVEPVPARRDLARRFGADAAVAPETVRGGSVGLPAAIDADGPADVPGSTDGAPTESEPAGTGVARTAPGPTGADLVYELSGRPATLDDAIAAAGYDARVIVGSWYGDKQAPVGLGGRFHRDRIEVRSSQVSTLDPETRGRWTKDRRLDVAMDHLRRLETDALVTHRLPFAEAPRAYRLLDDDAEETLQMLLTYDTI